MLMNPFSTWLFEIGRSGVIIQPDDLEAEGQGNLWSFTLSAEEQGSITADFVEKFVAGVVRLRQDWLKANEAEPMVLYWWHDEQAGQLRFSLVSASHGKLPFRCKVEKVAVIGLIAEEWLRSGHHGIVLEESAAGAKENEEQPESMTLKVWQVIVP